MSETITVPMRAQRDLKTVTTEIRSIQAQCRTMVLNGAIEIGRRLYEAKGMLAHGEWGEWLKNEVEFSHSTANNCMRLFDEYGADQITLEGAVAKSQAIGNLSPTKALKLLLLPEEERETFAENHDIEKMSTRELERAIREKDEAQAEARASRENAEKARKAQQEGAEAHRKAEEKLRAESDRLRKELREAEKEASAAAGRAEAAEAKLRAAEEAPEMPPERLEELRRDIRQEGQEALEKARGDAEKAREEARKAQAAAEYARQEQAAAEHRAEELRKKLAASNGDMAEFKLLFTRVQEEFSRLVRLREEIQQKDPEQGKKLLGAMGALVESVQKKLEG